MVKETREARGIKDTNIYHNNEDIEGEGLSRPQLPERLTQDNMVAALQFQMLDMMARQYRNNEHEDTDDKAGGGQGLNQV